VIFVFSPLRVCLKIKLDPTTGTGIELSYHVHFFTSYRDIARAYFLYYNPWRNPSTDNDDSTNKPFCLCNYLPSQVCSQYRRDSRQQAVGYKHEKN